MPNYDLTRQTPGEMQVTMEQFRAHVAAQPRGRRIDEVVVHHTWSPNASQYRGIETVRGVRNYHMGIRGWRDNGYHVMFAPDGSIFLCRPIQDQGAHTSGRNSHTIGVSFIANFDSDEPTKYGGMQAGMLAVAALLDRFELGVDAIRFHREFENKTCPGLKLGIASFRREVERYMGPQATVIVNGQQLPGEVSELRDGSTWVRARDICEAAGGTVTWDPDTKTAEFTFPPKTE